MNEVINEVLLTLMFKTSFTSMKIEPNCCGETVVEALLHLSFISNIF